MLKRLFILILLASGALGLQACGRESQPEEACNFVQNSKAQRVSWGANTPVVLWLDRSVPPEFYGAIEEAVREWNNSRGRELLRIGGPTNSAMAQARDGANVISWMSTWEPDRPFEQARTTVYWAGDQIYEADIRVNAKDFRYAVGRAAGRVDVVSLLVHELGHVLGLSHTEGSSSVMAKSLANNTERRSPTDDDIYSLKCEY